MSKIDFGALRAKRGGGNIKQMQAQLERNGQTGFKKDERLWKPEAGKSGTTSAIIRFLPIAKCDMESAADPDNKVDELDLTPMAKVIKHWFKGPSGKSYIETSPAMFGEPCPVREFDGPKWGQVKKIEDEDMRKAKRAELGLDNRLPRTEMYANILVIKDSTNPENEGQVMLWKFGNAVLKHLDRAQEPKFDHEAKFDPFCPWEGANLELNMEFEQKDFKGNKCWVPDYKQAKWSAPAPMGDDDFIEKQWGRCHSLAAFMDRSQVKTYDELQAKLFKVMDCDEEGNAAGSEAAANKRADQLMKQMEMDQENSGATGASKPPAEEQKAKSPMQQKMEEQKAKADDQAAAVDAANTANDAKSEDSAGGGDELDEFESMLAGM